MSKSYEGQTELDYCLECCAKHGQTAKVLMREALQRAQAENVGSEGVKEKIRGVVEELTGFEDDTDTIHNQKVANLNSWARDIRKFIHASKAEIGGADLETLRDIKSKVDGLVDTAYLVREEEEICVPCIAPFVCRGNPECEAFLEKVAEEGDKRKFDEAVELAKEKFEEEESGDISPSIPVLDLSEYGRGVAEKRKKLLEEVKADVAAS